MENYLVATSINPKSRVDHQVVCLAEWVRLGFKVVAFQHESEVSAVKELVNHSIEVFSLKDGATAATLFKKPIPRIKPVINTAIFHYKCQHLVLTNSDIYPAFRKSPVEVFALADACAFTRCDVLRVNRPIGMATQYRGGLDVFSFNKPALAQLWEGLKSTPVSERMTFGIPGWDYFMGALVLYEMKGLLLDCRELHHVWHRPSYSNLEEFENYVGPISSLGLIRQQQETQSASAFAKLIDKECEKNQKLTNLISSMYASYGVDAAVDEHTDVPADFITWLRSISSLAQFVDSICEVYGFIISDDVNSHLLFGMLIRSKSRSVAFNSMLAIMLACYVARRVLNKKINVQYPPNNSHSRSIQNILAGNSLFDKRCGLAELVFDELLVHGIYNAADFAALAYSCINDEERALVKCLILEIKNDLTSSCN